MYPVEQVPVWQESFSTFLILEVVPICVGLLLLLIFQAASLQHFSSFLVPVVAIIIIIIIVVSDYFSFHFLRLIAHSFDRNLCVISHLRMLGNVTDIQIDL
jgi:purine-cytosine permease-like protein